MIGIDFGARADNVRWGGKEMADVLQRRSGARTLHISLGLVLLGIAVAIAALSAA